MKISLIVAVAEDGAIGDKGNLLWHLSSDLKRFKAITTGYTIIMGRKTYDSLPNGALPNRRNIVISRQLKSLKDAEVYSDIDEALKATSDEDTVYIIGGGEIYNKTFPRADELHITLVHKSYPEADTRFPEWKLTDWNILKQEQIGQDEKNELDSVYYHLTRK
ncbi:MAG: dihydrofolate reductase [Porphyromonas sp.]|nr:dihydrofolate reductase [Porphyromonas sp.]